MGAKVQSTTVPGAKITSSALVQLRGTSGSGKSTAMKYLISKIEGFKPVETKESSRGSKVRAYKGKLRDGTALYDIYVLGDYSPDRSAGGCDTIPSIQEICDLVEKYGSKKKSILVFEGLLIAHSWGALGEYVHPRWGARYVNAFLDTPVDTCIERVTARRAGKGRETEGDRADKIEKNIRDDYHRVELCYDRVVNKGGVRVDIEHMKAKDQFYKLVLNTARKYCV